MFKSNFIYILFQWARLMERGGESLSRRRLGRAVMVGGAMLAMTVSDAGAATKNFKVTKAAVVTAVNAYARGMGVNIDNWGKLRNRGHDSVTWYTENSYILYPSGKREPLVVERSETFMTSSAAARRYNVYIDDMATQNIDVQMDGSDVKLRMFFESGGDEARVGCIVRVSDKECKAHILNHKGDINNAHIYIWFKVRFSGPRITLVPDRIDFDYDLHLDSWILNTISNSAPYFTNMKKKIEQRLREQIFNELNKPENRARLSHDLNDVLSGTMSDFFRRRLGASNVSNWIDRNTKITRVREQGTNYIVTVRYPDIVGPDSVRIVSFKPKSANLTAGCPINFGFDASIKTDAKVSGKAWMQYENGRKSGKLDWRMNGAGKADSTIIRKINGRPGDDKQGWARMVVQWKDSLGRTQTNRSGKANFHAHCSTASGNLQSN